MAWPGWGAGRERQSSLGRGEREGVRFGTNSWALDRAWRGKERREDLRGAGTAPKGFEETLAGLPISIKSPLAPQMNLQPK